MSSHYKMKHLVSDLNKDTNSALIDRIQEIRNGWLALDSGGTPLSLEGEHIVYESILDAFVALKNDADKCHVEPCSSALIRAAETLSHFEKILFDSIWYECQPIEPGEMINIELDIPIPYYEVCKYASQILSVAKKIERSFTFSGSHVRPDASLHSSKVYVDVEFRRTTVMLTVTSEE